MEQIIVIKDFLTQEECQYFIDLIDNKNKNHVQAIIQDKNIAEDFYRKHKEVFDTITLKGEPVLGLYPDVTLAKSKNAIRKHVDQKLNDTKWKLLIYLNKVDNGGTIFYIDKTKHKVENYQGCAVIFDISLPHEGEVYKNQIKYTLGFRIIT